MKEGVVFESKYVECQVLGEEFSAITSYWSSFGSRSVKTITVSGPSAKACSVSTGCCSVALTLAVPTTEAVQRACQRMGDEREL